MHILGLLTLFSIVLAENYLLFKGVLYIVMLPTFGCSDFSFVFCEGCIMLQNNLALLLEEGDLDSDLRFKTMNITKMATYILTQMMRGFEEKLSQKSSNGILIDIGKVRFYAILLI